MLECEASGLYCQHLINATPKYWFICRLGAIWRTPRLCGSLSSPTFNRRNTEAAELARRMRDLSWTRSIVCFLLLLLSVAIVPSIVSAQASLKIAVLPSVGVEVTGTGLSPANRWSFRNAIANSLGLAERVGEFRAFDVDGREVATRKVATGEYRAEENAAAFKFKIRLGPVPASASAHVSSLSDDFGVLMLRDLLPLNLGEFGLEFELPKGWSSFSSIGTGNSYRVVQPDKAVFLVGRDVRRSSASVDDVDVELLVADAFPVSDKDVLKPAKKIIAEYIRLTNAKPSTKVAIILVPLRNATTLTRWKAEAIGNTSLLFIDPRAKFSNWRGQFGVIFTHELFHLWVPNSLDLAGEYDWFFEGFTLYTALLTALDQKLIDFQEYLDTLGRVYDSYLSYPDLSLLDATDRRWSGNGAAVYDKGMLVAFLYDLMVRRESHSKATVRDLYRSLFSTRRVEMQDANQVIIGLLTSGAKSFPRSYVESAARLELDKLLPEFGLELDSSRSVSKIRAARVLTGEQQQLLKSLGYRK